MREVANINGVPVHSDKTGGISVAGSVIRFADGSYADVSTGEVVNKGRGSISIGSPPGGAGEVVTRAEEFEVSVPCELSVRELAANVQIRTHEANKITVKLEGPKAELDLISVRKEENAVIIEGQDDAGGGGVSIVGGDIVAGRSIISTGRGVTIRTGGATTRIGGRVRGAIVVSGGGSVVVGGGIGASETKITVTIPKQTNVEIANVDGKVDLADIDGTLRTCVGGVGDIRGGRVKSARLRISGSGSVVLSEVTGRYLRARISGSGNVQVAGGEVDEIECSVSGSGQINFGGTAEDGDLDVSGSGSINVSHITNRPSRNVSGVGTIHIGNWPAKQRRDW